MIIGAFSYNKAKDSYAGEIKTLSLLRGKVEFRPTKGRHGRGRDYRVTVTGAPDAVELGAAWKRISEAGRDFLSVRLDDPALPHLLNAALMPAEDGASAILIWSRSTPRVAKAK
jgi:uncharacterized protein (DUF736 family)